jgi:hypothetical protein
MVFQQTSWWPQGAASLAAKDLAWGSRAHVAGVPQATTVSTSFHCHFSTLFTWVWVKIGYPHVSQKWMVNTKSRLKSVVPS